MKILFIGDIFGKAGIQAIEKNLAFVKQKYNIDYVIANGENTTLCRGLNMDDYKTLCDLGIQFFTMGNHTWRQKDFPQLLAQSNIVRPSNISGNEKYVNDGVGYKTIQIKNKKILIVNLMGESIKLNPTLEITIDNPFQAFDKILKEVKADIVICDFHSETTSEKNCFFYVYQSRCTAIIGTHSHVQTNDAIVRKGTAYITDAGMTGPANAIIGADPETLVKMFTGESERFILTEAETNEFQFNAVVLDIDENTNKAISIETINILN